MGLFNSIKIAKEAANGDITYDAHTINLPYGYCETAASTTAKTVTIPNINELTEGLAIIVRFKNSNSASSPTLNVNGLGAKNIYRYGTTKASTSTTVSGWVAGAVQLFVYNGTGWVRDYWSNTTYTNAALGQGFAICDTDAATAAKTCSISSYTLATGGVVAIQFTNGNTASSPTLNITEKGAKPIYYNGGLIDNDTFIQPGDICTFMYDSSTAAYHLLTNDRWYKDIQAFDILEEIGTNTITWDGNTTGLASIEGVFYHVSDIAPTLEDLQKGLRFDSFYNNRMASSTVLPSEIEDRIYEDSGIISIDDAILIAPQANDIAPKAGIYFIYIPADGEDLLSDSYVTQLTINEYSGFSQQYLKEQYLPQKTAQDIASLQNFDMTCFNITPGDTLTWDLNVEDKVFFEWYDEETSDSFYFVKVSDNVVTLEELQDGIDIYQTYWGAFVSNSAVPGTLLEEENGVISGLYVYFVSEDNLTYQNLTFPEKGIYLQTGTNPAYLCTRGIKIHNYTKFNNTLTWDGDKTNKITVAFPNSVGNEPAMELIKISNQILSISDLQYGINVLLEGVNSDSEAYEENIFLTLDDADYPSGDDVIFFNVTFSNADVPIMIAFVGPLGYKELETEGYSFALEPGIYVSEVAASIVNKYRVKQLTINNYSFPSYTLKKEFLPNSLLDVELGYGTCTNPSDTAIKVALLSNDGFTLKKGSVAIIHFNKGNTASNPMLNVNGTGTKPIYQNGQSTNIYWEDGAIQMFIYDGTNWNIISAPFVNNAYLGQGYSTASQRFSLVDKKRYACTLSNYKFTIGGVLAIQFTQDVVKNATLQINDGNIIPIYYNNNPIAENIIKANDIATFIYDGECYRLISIDRWQNDINTLKTSVQEAKDYADTIKDDLLNGAGEAYDTLKELGDLIDENTDALDALEEVAINKMDKNNPTGTGSFSMNRKSGTTIGNYSVAEGQYATASGDRSHAEGYFATASGTSSHAEGNESTASGSSSHAEGDSTTASGEFSHAEGVYTHAIGRGSHAEGGSGAPQPGGQAYGDCSHAEGYNTFAIGTGSHAEGKNSPGFGDQISLTGEAATTTYTFTYSGRDYLNFLKIGNVCYYNGRTSRIIAYNASNSTVTFEYTLNPSEEFNNTTVEIFTAGSFGSYSHSEGENTIASGNSSHAEGYYAGAIGNDAHAEGYYTQAKGIGSHAEGCKTKATGFYAHAEGGCAGGDTMGSDSSEAYGLNSHAEGSSTYAAGEAGHAEGYSTSAYGAAAHAEGYDTSTSGQGAHAEGYKTRAVGQGAHAEGGSYHQLEPKHGITGYSDSRSIYTAGDMGGAYTTYYGPYAAGNNSHAEGGLTYAKAVASHAEGGYTSALGAESHAEGQHTIASGHQSHAEGFWTTAMGEKSHAEGHYTIAVGNYSHAEGRKYSTAYPTLARIKSYQLGAADENGYYTLLVDSVSNLSVNMFISTGYPNLLEEGAATNTPSAYLNDINNFAKIVEIDASNKQIKIDRTLYIPLPASSGDPSNAPIYPFFGGAYGEASHTSGYNCLALGDYSFAKGIGAIAEGKASSAEGGTYNTYKYGGPIASGNYSHAEGVATQASGDVSHAEGNDNIASGYASHAEGQRNKATGAYSHAEGGSGGGGFGNTASGQSSHAEGDCTTASGLAAHAEGGYTRATGKYSHAGGYYTKASSQYQTVIGKYNQEDTANTYAFIVGNGTGSGSSPEAYRNAFTVDWSGNGVFKGGITASNFNGYTIAKSVPSDAKFTDTTYSAATTSANGLMTAAMVTKLNGIATGANKYSLPAATSSALGGVKIGSNISVSSGTISLTKSNVTSALGYTPTNKEFIFDTYSKSVTINPGDQAVTVSALTQRSGYTLLGYINQNGGYTDQWLISYGTYGGNVVAMVHSKYTSTLTQTISCTAIWYKNQ